MEAKNPPKKQKDVVFLSYREGKRGQKWQQL